MIVGILSVLFIGVFFSVYPFSFVDPDDTPIPPDPLPDDDDEEEEEEVLSDTDPPVEPVLNIIASPTITGDIHISWNSVSDANDYAVYRSDDDNVYDLLEKVYINSYDDLIEENGEYYYKIRAGNEGGVSDYSNIESVIVAIPTVPNAPQTNKITYEIVDSGVKITVSWSEVSCNSYKLYMEFVSETKSTGFVLIEDDLTSTSYSVVLTDIGKYYYKVFAVNDIGESEQSNLTTINITEDGISELDDYTWLYVVIVVLGLLLVPVIILTRKRKKKK